MRVSGFESELCDLVVVQPWQRHGLYLELLSLYIFNWKETQKLAVATTKAVVRNVCNGSYTALTRMSDTRVRKKYYSFILTCPVPMFQMTKP